jgi:hypothetical protein
MKEKERRTVPAQRRRDRGPTAVQAALFCKRVILYLPVAHLMVLLRCRFNIPISRRIFPSNPLKICKTCRKFFPAESLPLVAQSSLAPPMPKHGLTLFLRQPRMRSRHTGHVFRHRYTRVGRHPHCIATHLTASTFFLRLVHPKSTQIRHVCAKAAKSTQIRLVYT